MSDPVYILVAYADYYPVGGVGDITHVFTAPNDEAAREVAIPIATAEPHEDNIDLIRLNPQTNDAKEVTSWRWSSTHVPGQLGKFSYSVKEIGS